VSYPRDISPCSMHVSSTRLSSCPRPQERAEAQRYQQALAVASALGDPAAARRAISEAQQKYGEELALQLAEQRATQEREKARHTLSLLPFPLYPASLAGCFVSSLTTRCALVTLCLRTPFIHRPTRLPSFMLCSLGRSCGARQVLAHPSPHPLVAPPPTGPPPRPSANVRLPTAAS